MERMPRQAGLRPVRYLKTGLAGGKESPRMKWHSSLLLLPLLASALPAQAPPSPEFLPSPPAFPAGPVAGSCPEVPWNAAPASDDGPLASNRKFSNFIGFMSNPLQNVDPRALTQIQPIFLSAWVSTTPALPELNGQVG